LSCHFNAGTISRQVAHKKSNLDTFQLSRGADENQMPYADLLAAGRHGQSMRDIVVLRTGGWQDDRSLEQLQGLADAAASSVGDAECKALLAAIVRLATDLFSAAGHARWAQGHTSGADFLRLQILREIKAFQDRLAAIDAMRTGPIGEAQARREQDRR
jgi:hypothetical protein